MDVEQKEGDKKETVEETLNAQKAIWLRNKTEVKPEEYDAFYKQIAHDTEKPARVIHYAAEGKTEFKVLVFIPAHKPFAFDWEEPKGLKLYVQRVLIMDPCEELLPPYLRFVKGVVDSADLPLNISRELLQQNPLLDLIQKNVVRNVLEALEEMKNVEYEKYVAVLRGPGGDAEGRGGPRLGEPREARRPAAVRVDEDRAGQVHDAGGVRRADAGRAEGDLLPDRREPRDHRVVAVPGGVPGQGLGSAAADRPDRRVPVPVAARVQGQAAQAGRPGGHRRPGGRASRPTRSSSRPSSTLLKAKLPEVGDVRLSRRLKESAAGLVADRDAMTAHFERLMQQMGRVEEESKRVLELNPSHPAVAAVKACARQGRGRPAGRELRPAAVRAGGDRGGSKVKDPAGFARRVNELMAQVAAGGSVFLA